MPTAGTPRDDTRPKSAGNSRSCAAAIGTWPMSSVHPFSAPSDEIMTATPTMSAAQPPHMIRAASANGAADFTSSSRGTTPRTTVVPRT